MKMVGLALMEMAVVCSLHSVTSCCKWLWCWHILLALQLEYHHQKHVYGHLRRLSAIFCLHLGHHAGGASKYMRDAPSSGRYNLCHKSGPQVEASDQGLTSSRNMKRPLSIPDVDRAHLCITKTNFFNKYAMVGFLHVFCTSRCLDAKAFGM